ncbi:MAG: CpsD/CapB family tyrosine-protein kinase [Steroidobacteraceae bacterium]
MFIERAIEKAKELQRAREAAKGPAGPAAPSQQPGINNSAAARANRRPAATPSQYHRQLTRVELDAAECERNRILFEQEGPSELSHAGPAYRVLRSRVQQKVHGGNCSCIGITSPGPGEGKTITAVNLAISVAKERQRPVYLLDLDMRNPSVATYTRAKLPAQISRFLSEEIAPEKVLFATNIEMLVIAGNHQPIVGGSELLANHRLDELIAHIRRHSPDAMIIIDLPPVNLTDEALKVAPRVDAMFMVVSETKTRRDALARGLSLLSDFNVAGIILNRSAEDVGQYYYGY